MSLASSSLVPSLDNHDVKAILHPYVGEFEGMTHFTHCIASSTVSVRDTVIKTTRLFVFDDSASGASSEKNPAALSLISRSTYNIANWNVLKTPARRIKCHLIYCMTFYDTYERQF